MLTDEELATIEGRCRAGTAGVGDATKLIAEMRRLREALVTCERRANMADELDARHQASAQENFRLRGLLQPGESVPAAREAAYALVEQALTMLNLEVTDGQTEGPSTVWPEYEGKTLLTSIGSERDRQLDEARRNVDSTRELLASNRYPNNRSYYEARLPRHEARVAELENLLSASESTEAPEDSK